VYFPGAPFLAAAVRTTNQGPIPGS
jgi:hypothetical protein